MAIRDIHQNLIIQTMHVFTQRNKKVSKILITNKSTEKKNTVQIQIMISSILFISHINDYFQIQIVTCVSFEIFDHNKLPQSHCFFLQIAFFCYKKS